MPEYQTMTVAPTMQSRFPGEIPLKRQRRTTIKGMMILLNEEVVSLDLILVAGKG